MGLRGKFAKNKEITEIDKLKSEFLQKQLIKPKYAAEQKPMFAAVAEGYRKWLAGSGKKTAKSLAHALFRPMVEKYRSYFGNLDKNITLAGMHILPETYMSMMLALAFMMGLFGGISAFATGIGIGMPAISATFMALVATIGLFFLTLIIFYTYPGLIASERKKSLDTNLPFALNHMAAIASSGVPPENVFKLLTKLGEYGAITDEARKITKIVDVFGEDLTAALNRVAKETPSQDFKSLLSGMLAVIESGGNLQSYLNESAQAALFNYKLSRRKYLETLSTYADIYTALLIAAPLFLVSILVIINIIPGSLVAGLTVPTVLKIGVYGVIPMLNILFLALLTYMQPEV